MPDQPKDPDETPPALPVTSSDYASIGKQHKPPPPPAKEE